MTLPMVVLAAGCFLVGIAPAQVVRPLLHVVAQVGRMERATISGQFETAIEPLGSITLAVDRFDRSGACACGASQSALERKERVELGHLGMWLHPTNGADAVHVFVVCAARGRFLSRRCSVCAELWSLLVGFFPKQAAFSLRRFRTPPRSSFIARRFGWSDDCWRGCAGFSAGYLHVYMLYIGVTLVALLIWYIGIHLRSR